MLTMQQILKKTTQPVKHISTPYNKTTIFEDLKDFDHYQIRVEMRLMPSAAGTELVAFWQLRAVSSHSPSTSQLVVPLIAGRTARAWC